jgi:hypothetical protein
MSARWQVISMSHGGALFCHANSWLPASAIFHLCATMRYLSVVCSPMTNTAPHASETAGDDMESCSA